MSTRRQLRKRVGTDQAGTRRRSLVIRAPSEHMRFEFLPPCGRIVAVCSRAKGLVLRHSRNRLDVRFTEAVARPLELEIEYTGEVLELSSVSADPRLRACRCALEDYWGWRSQKANNGLYTAAKLYFNLVDRYAPMQSAEVDGLAKKCQLRLNDRRGTVDPPFSPTRPQQPALQYFSRLLLDGLVQYMPGTTHGFDLAQAEEAFERFAAGELSLVDDEACYDEAQRQACQPNSTYFFLFAEFADMCIKANIGRDAWTDLLPSLVHSAEVFCEYYRTSSGGAVLSVYETAYLRDVPPKTHRTSPEIASALSAFKQANPTSIDLRRSWQGTVNSRLDFTTPPAPLVV